MKPSSILLVGAGGHARACIDVIEMEGRYTIGGLIGLPEEVGEEILGYRILGSDADLSSIVGDFAGALVTVGQIKTAEPRVRLFDRLVALGVSLPVIVSPLAHVSKHASVGVGTIVMHGAIINASVQVGRNCIVNSHALIEHDSAIGDHCHISTAAAINSGVQVGARTFIGSNASVRQCVALGEGCLVGMGERVLADCPAGTRLSGRRSKW